MGPGRNALCLASKAWDATGCDVAEQGLEIAQASARKAGLKLNTVRASHAEFDCGAARWDLVVEAFAFTELADAAHRSVVESLKPGGVLVIDGFGGGPKKQMLEWFARLAARKE